MNPAQLELVYEDLAVALDATAASKRELFLAKLALLLAQDFGDAERVRTHIAAALANIDA